jgi:geranylgeranyl pyrophosphate synthase
VDAAAAHLRGLIHQRADAAGAAARLLAEEIQRASAHLERLETLLKEAQSQAYERARIESSQQRALERIADVGIAEFWQQESRAIHQTLADLFGDWRMVVLDKEILGAEYRPGVAC